MLTTHPAYPTTTSVSRDGGLLAAVLALVIAGAAAGLVVFGPPPAAAAVQQTWPPFALVTGLLLIGRVAAGDNMFAAAGSRIARIRGGPAMLLAAALGLTAIVTAVLNLDTAVVFLTPVLIQTARSRGLSEPAFVYGAVFMSNAASLLLAGSNLTNLLVLEGARTSGFDFARSMLAPWLVAVTVTWLAISVLQRGRATAASIEPAPAALPLRGRAGVAAVSAAAALLVVLPDPAVPVLLLGAGVTTWAALRRRLDTAALRRAIPLTLVGIFVLAVSVGTVARLWLVPALLVTTAGRPEAVLVGAIGAVAINNLPAASLLSSQPLAHPLFLLLGLNLGPNLAVTGSLSAILWLRLARQNGAKASVWTYTRLGLLIAPLELAAAAVTLAIVHPSA